MGYIYKITNKLNGKIYIGKTNLFNPYDRFKEHKQDSKKARNKNRPLYRAFNKYGIENFEFTVIEESDNIEDREKYYINLYKSFSNVGYNATKGGDGKPYLNLDENKVIGIYETYKTFNRTAMYFGVDSKTIKQIILNNKHEIYEYSNKIKIVQLDLKFLDVIHVYESYSDANRSMNAKVTAKKIRSVIENKSKNAYGYHWMIYEDYVSLTEERKCQIISYINDETEKRKYIKQKIICTTTGEVFDSAKDASIKVFNKKTVPGISQCCLGTGKRITCGKDPITNEPLKWMFLNEYLKQVA